MDNSSLNRLAKACECLINQIVVNSNLWETRGDPPMLTILRTLNLCVWLVALVVANDQLHSPSFWEIDSQLSKYRCF